MPYSLSQHQTKKRNRTFPKSWSNSITEEKCLYVRKPQDSRVLPAQWKDSCSKAADHWLMLALAFIKRTKSEKAAPALGWLLCIWVIAREALRMMQTSYNAKGTVQWKEVLKLHVCHCAAEENMLKTFILCARLKYCLARTNKWQ